MEKIKSNILRLLYDESPKALSATEVAGLEARDKQFVLALLEEMERKHLVKNVSKDFTRKKFWVMTEAAYKKYKELL